MSIAALVKTLLDAGVDADTIVAAVRAVEGDSDGARPSAGAERTRRWRERKASQSVTVTSPPSPPSQASHVTLTSPPPDVPPLPPAPPSPPLNPPVPKPDGFGPALPGEGPKQRLWSEGLPALLAMGVGERRARTIVGQWLRDAEDDADRVLGAIQRAREHAPLDPIPWITAGFAKIKARRNTADDRKNALREALGPSAYDILAERDNRGAAEHSQRLSDALPRAG